MAAIDPTVSQGVHPGITMVKWVLATGDTATPYEGPDNADKTLHVYGTFGSGTISITGSNDNTNYADMSDSSGDAVSITSGPALAVLLESPRYIIPVLTGGSAGSVTVILCARKTD